MRSLYDGNVARGKARAPVRLARSLDGEVEKSLRAEAQRAQGGKIYAARRVNF
jgi:hypothetical protein